MNLKGPSLHAALCWPEHLLTSEGELRPYSEPSPKAGVHPSKCARSVNSFWMALTVGLKVYSVTCEDKTAALYS
jgi:hypothetical protein